MSDLKLDRDCLLFSVTVIRTQGSHIVLVQWLMQAGPVNTMQSGDDQAILSFVEMVYVKAMET